MAQFARPDSNITQTGFTGGFADIDETTASDADFAYTADNTLGQLEVGLTNVTDPSSSTGHILRYRLAKADTGVPPSTDGNTQLGTVSLYQGATLIAADAERTLGAWTDYSLTLSGAQADAITDYTNLRIRFDSPASGGGPTGNRRGGAISWAELEVPNIPATVSQSLTADASIAKNDIPQSITADAHISRTNIGGSLTADAFVRKNDIAGSITADAFISSSVSASLTADAFIQKITSGSFSADSNIQNTVAQTATADAFIKATLAGSLTADAYIRITATGSLTADAFVQTTTTGGFTADAEISLVGRIDWTTPGNGDSITNTPTFAFLIPQATGNIFFHIELDTVNTFNGADFRSAKSALNQAGWEYHNGTTWVAVPATGVLNSYSGNEARYSPSALATNTWYRRVRGGV